MTASPHELAQAALDAAEFAEYVDSCEDASELNPEQMTALLNLVYRKA